MALSAETIQKLGQPLNPVRVKHREGGGGRSLSYLEGHDVIRTANEVFGVGEWFYNVKSLECIGTEPVTAERYGETKTGHRVAYRAVVEVVAGSTQFSDVGYGDAQEYTGSALTPHELASKEAVTDGLKRALKNYGDQFGLVLYDKDAPEHNGGSGSLGGDSGGRSAARPPQTTSGSNGNGGAGTLRWKYGEYANTSIADTPLDYVIEYATSGNNEFMRSKCQAFLDESGAVGGNGAYAKGLDALKQIEGDRG